MKHLLLALFCFCSLSSYAQIADYPFNTNTNDVVGGFDLNTFGNPQFITTGGDQIIVLDGDDYMNIPPAFSAEINPNEGLMFSVRFKVTDWHLDNPFNGETGFGNRIIITNKNENHHERGFKLMALEWFGNFQVLANYGDGLVDDNGDYLTEGKLDVVLDHVELDTWYDLTATMVLDDANPYIRYTVNSTVVNSFFDPTHVDVNSLITSLSEQQIWVGTDSDNLLGNATGPFPAIQLDYLSIFNPPPAGETTVINTVLNTFIDQMNGSISLSPAQENTLFSDFVTNWDGNSYAANEALIATYRSTYSSREGTIFEDIEEGKRVSEMPIKMRIQYLLEQWMLDNLYTTENMLQMVGTSFLDHTTFPGRVSAAAARITGGTFTVDGDYNTDPGFELNNQELVIRPTGYYAAPGELITLHVPAAAVNQGMNVRIGAHHYNLEETHSFFKRFPRMGVEVPIQSNSVQITSPFGGGIYLTVPDNSNLGALDFSVDGAVKSPYFSTKPDFTTDLATFQNDLANAHVIWVDWESENFLMTFPIGTASLVNDPTEALGLWDEALDVYNLITGRPAERIRSEYLLVEKQNHTVGTVPASYPMSFESSFFEEPAPDDMPVNILNEEFFMNSYAVATAFHEWGHLHNMPTIPNETETNVELPFAVVLQTVFDLDFETAMDVSTQQRLDLDESALDWILTPPFRLQHRIHLDTFNYSVNDIDNTVQLPYQARGYAKYVDIAQLYSWETLGGINGHFYEEALGNSSFDYYEIEYDEYIEAASEQVGVNMAPFFEFWGIIPSDELVQTLSTFPDDDLIKDRLLHYRSVVPRNQTEYQVVYNAITATIEEHHHVRYDNMLLSYNEAVADSIVGQIDFILCKYFDTNCTSEFLPVELLDFQGKPEKTHNYLEWVTTYEENSSHFDIQRLKSTSTNWETIGQVAAAGASNVDKRYNFRDNHPHEITYYRLKAVDTDGQFTYSNIITLTLAQRIDLGTINVYPNPVTHQAILSIYSEVEKNIYYKITAADGRVLQSQIAVLKMGSNTLPLAIQHLPAACYFLLVNDSQQAHYIKVIKE